MNTFELMLDLIDEMKKNNYNQIVYNNKWEKLVEENIIKVNRNNFISIYDDYIQDNFDKFLKKGYTRYELLTIIKSPMYPVYFKNDVLAQYINNPSYHFPWNHYRGLITSSENNDNYVMLEHVCLAYDVNKNIPKTMIMTKDLVGMDKDFQRYIERFEIKNRDNLVVHSEIRKNLIEGTRSDINNIDIYMIY